MNHFKILYIIKVIGTYTSGRVWHLLGDRLKLYLFTDERIYKGWNAQRGKNWVLCGVAVAEKSTEMFQTFKLHSNLQKVFKITVTIV
jgi:hypothetical protein